MNNVLKRLLVGGSTVALSAAVSGAALAQANGDIEQVVVSASRITIGGYTAPTPVTVVGAAQIEREGYANIADSVRTLPQLQAPPSSFSQSQSQPSMGTAGGNFVNLRNLGIPRTLVLVDSQRMPAATVATGVDMTTFPQAVISRIDVVTGGASASWGSDAVAGVTNFVLNKNINGVKGTAVFGETTSGKVRDISADTAWGGDVLGGRGHIEVAGNVHIRPDVEMLVDTNWYKGSYWVSNPAYAPGNGQPQLIVASNVGLATATPGGLITASPAGVAGPGITPAPANALRGIKFVGDGIPEIVNFGNVTLNTLSNGGTLTMRDTQDPLATITAPTATYGFFAYGRYKLTDDIQISAQMNYGYFTGKGEAVPAVQNTVTVRSDNAFIPASVKAAMTTGGIASFTLGTLNLNNFDSYHDTGRNYYSMAQNNLGPGTFITRRQIGRIVLTLDGTLGPDWSWTAYVQHGATRFSIHDLNIPITANLMAAEDAVVVTSANRGSSGAALGSIACRSTLTGTPVVSGSFSSQSGCVPLNIFGTGVASQAAIAYINGYSAGTLNYLHMTLQQDVVEGSMQGILPWELPAGKVAVAFGGGYRKEQGASLIPDIAVLAAMGQGNGINMPPSQYNVIEGFAEINAPILKDNIVESFDVSMAGRITNYSTSGLVETWKLGMTSQINDDIKVRATWSVDIRAPQLNDLFTVSSSAPSNQQVDPKTNQFATVITRTTGNPDLVPEVARTVSGGAVLTPTFIHGLNFSADWYSINVTNAITSVATTLILNECNPALPSLIHIGQKGNLNDPLCSALVFNGTNGALSAINNKVINFASQTVSGLDMQLNYETDFFDGTLSWQAMANLNDENTLTNPGAGSNDSAGSSGGNPPGGPKWRGTLSTTYDNGPYSFTATGRWFGTSVQYQDGNTGNQASAANALLYDPKYFEVPVTAYLDIRASYKWSPNISLFLNIDNTLNTPPPLVAPTRTSVQAAGVQFFNTNTYIYDMLGRNVRIGLRFNY